MIYNVPFIENSDDRCTVAVIGMILAYFMPERHFTVADTETMCGYEKGRSIWKAASMLSLAKLGFQLYWIEDFDHDKFIVDPKGYLKSILDEEAYAWQVAHGDLNKEAERIKQYLESGLPLKQRRATDNDIRRFLDEGWLVHLEVNANVLSGKTGYEGHSILVIGYDEGGVTIHNPDGVGGNKPRQYISWKLLDTAWKEFGGSYSLYAFKK